MPANPSEKAPCVVLMDRDCVRAQRSCSQLALAGLDPLSVDEELQLFAAVRRGPVDLALLQIDEIDTVEMDLPETLRKICPEAYLPVVVLSEAPTRWRCELLRHGADDVISQETESEEVVARLETLVRIKTLHEQLAAKQEQLLDVLRREHELLNRLREDNAALKEQAATDPLTHLQNRRSFNELLGHEFKVSRRYGRPISLLMLDVDHFKVINDTHGHPSGDYVLKELAVILKQQVRESDVVARTGGEEFSVILPRASQGEAGQFAQRIRQAVYQRDFAVFGAHIHATISIGTATYPSDREIASPGMLIYMGDQALLHAKETGRDRVVAFGSLERTTRRRMCRHYRQMENQAKRREAWCSPDSTDVSSEK
ncbi:MAG: GGDEF domain-containing protein [Phycisphaerae bacterium]